MTCLKLWFVALVAFFPTICTAMMPPENVAEKPPEPALTSVDLEYALKTYRVSDALARQAYSRILNDTLKLRGLSDAEILEDLMAGPNMAFPYATRPELRSKGTVKTLTILLEFADYQCPLSADSIDKQIYQHGLEPALAPYSGLYDYYYSVSERQLDVQGSVLGWYRFDKARRYYEPKPPAGATKQEIAKSANLAIFRMVSEALKSYENTHDFTQYDNDLDGDIDVVNILYAGPHGAWRTFWWTYQWSLFVPEAYNFRVDGKRLRAYP